MKTILRNFWTVLLRFKAAALLNVLGLTVAFAAFILIMMQVDYDYNYNKQVADAEFIYRLEIMFGEKVQAIVSRPLAEGFFNSSSYIEAGAVANLWFGQGILEAEVHGEKQFFEGSSISVTDGFTDVFRFEMLEGIAESIREP